MFCCFVCCHLSGSLIVLLPHSKRVVSSTPGLRCFYAEFACSPCVSMGSLRLLLLALTVQHRAGEVKLLLDGTVCLWRLVQGVTLQRRPLLVRQSRSSRTDTQGQRGSVALSLSCSPSPSSANTLSCSLYSFSIFSCTSFYFAPPPLPLLLLLLLFLLLLMFLLLPYLHLFWLPLLILFVILFPPPSVPLPVLFPSPPPQAPPPPLPSPPPCETNFSPITSPIILKQSFHLLLSSRAGPGPPPAPEPAIDQPVAWQQCSHIMLLTLCSLNKPLS